ncbi:MAG TPA: hypothetical protein VD963_07210, partial [Phycisphaerales bacterium]|nr:hypothetical protein [Phycisphaerales bacterium]
RQPSLAWTPVDPLALPGGAAGMRRRVESAVGHANRVKSASAWLTVATLMQSEGRDALAAKMLDRARAAGLSVPVYREMSQALRP